MYLWYRHINTVGILPYTKQKRMYPVHQNTLWVGKAEACHEASAYCLGLWITLTLISLLLLLGAPDFMTFLRPVVDQGTQAIISIRDEGLKCPLWHVSLFPIESQVEHAIYFTLSSVGIVVASSAFFTICCAVFLWFSLIELVYPLMHLNVTYNK